MLLILHLCNSSLKKRTASCSCDANQHQAYINEHPWTHTAALISARWQTLKFRCSIKIKASARARRRARGQTSRFRASARTSFGISVFEFISLIILLAFLLILQNKTDSPIGLHLVSLSFPIALPEAFSASVTQTQWTCPNEQRQRDDPTHCKSFAPALAPMTLLCLGTAQAREGS